MNEDSYRLNTDPGEYKLEGEGEKPKDIKNEELGRCRDDHQTSELWKSKSVGPSSGGSVSSMTCNREIQEDED